MSAILDRFGRAIGSARKAREVVIAPRVPTLKRETYTGDPFTSEGDVVMDCNVGGCGWHAMGPRLEAKEAWREHYRLYHSMETGVVLLNAPKQ